MNTRALTHYTALAAQAEACRIEQDRAAQIAVDDMLERIRQYDTGGCDDLSDTPNYFPRWMFWTFAICYSALLTFASWEFGMRVLPVIRGWLP